MAGVGESKILTATTSPPPSPGGNIPHTNKHMHKIERKSSFSLSVCSDPKYPHPLQVTKPPRATFCYHDFQTVLRGAGASKVCESILHLWLYMSGAAQASDGLR